MAVMNKKDLLYSDYSWRAIPGDDPKMRESPDDDLLNRSEGYEVLAFINEYLIDFGLNDVASGQKVEKMIRLNVPNTIHGRQRIKTWIRGYWNKY